MRPSTSEAPAALLPPPPLRLLPGGAIQFPDESFFSLWTSAFSRRTVIAMLRQLTFSEYDPSCGVILNSSGQVNG